MTFSLVPERFRNITQGVAPVDDRHQLASFDELLQNSQISPEEEAAVQEARDELAAGADLISNEDMKREFGIA